MAKIVSQDLYFTATSRIAQMETELRERQDAAKKAAQKADAIEKNCRELCEKILATNRDEMKLGTPYSWSQVPLFDLIIKANESYEKYIEHITTAMMKFMEEKGDLLAQNRALRRKVDELTRELHSGRTAKPSQTTSVDDVIKEEEDKQKEKKVIQNSDVDTKSAYNAGTLTVSDDIDDVFGSLDEALFNNSARESEKMKPRHAPVVNYKKGKRTEAIEKRAQEKAEREYAMVDINGIQSKIGKIGWDILSAIGEKGISRYPDIEQYVIDKDVATRNKNRVRNDFKALETSGIIEKEHVVFVGGHFNSCTLTQDIGVRIFKSKFKKNPVKPEADKIRSEHDNLSHGYSIVTLANTLKKSGYFKDINIYGRKSQIPTSHNQKFIPDLVAKDDADVSLYIEYECGTTPQTDFNSKCNKMAEVTDTINIVCPNQQIAENLKTQVVKWISSKGNASMNYVKVRITPYPSFKGEPIPDARKDDTWKFVFDLSASKEAKQNF